MKYRFCFFVCIFIFLNSLVYGQNHILSFGPKIGFGIPVSFNKPQVMYGRYVAYFTPCVMDRIGFAVQYIYRERLGIEVSVDPVRTGYTFRNGYISDLGKFIGINTDFENLNVQTPILAVLRTGFPGEPDSHLKFTAGIVPDFYGEDYYYPVYPFIDSPDKLLSYYKINYSASVRYCVDNNKSGRYELSLEYILPRDKVVREYAILNSINVAEYRVSYIMLSLQWFLPELPFVIRRKVHRGNLFTFNQKRSAISG